MFYCRLQVENCFRKLTKIDLFKGHDKKGIWIFSEKFNKLRKFCKISQEAMLGKVEYIQKFDFLPLLPFVNSTTVM